MLYSPDEYWTIAAESWNARGVLLHSYRRTWEFVKASSCTWSVLTWHGSCPWICTLFGKWCRFCCVCQLLSYFYLIMIFTYLVLETWPIHFSRWIGIMKKIVFKQFQLLLETSMLCIHLYCPTHPVMVWSFMKRKDLSRTLKTQKIPLVIQTFYPLTSSFLLLWLYFREASFTCFPSFASYWNVSISYLRMIILYLLKCFPFYSSLLLHHLEWLYYIISLFLLFSSLLLHHLVLLFVLLCCLLIFYSFLIQKKEVKKFKAPRIPV